MTLEEKAIEISNNAKKQIYFDSRCNDLVGNVAYQSAYVIAEWFKEYLEKRKQRAKYNADECTKYKYNSSPFDVEIDVMDEIINEFFKK